MLGVSTLRVTMHVHIPYCNCRQLNHTRTNFIIQELSKAASGKTKERATHAVPYIVLLLLLPA